MLLNMEKSGEIRLKIFLKMVAEYKLQVFLVPAIQTTFFPSCWQLFPHTVFLLIRVPSRIAAPPPEKSLNYDNLMNIS